MGWTAPLCLLLLAVNLGAAGVIAFPIEIETMKTDMKAEMVLETPPIYSQTLYELDKSAHKKVMDEIIDEELTKFNSSMVINYVLNQHEDYLYYGFMKIYKTILEKKLGDYVLLDLAFSINDAKLKGNVLSLLNIFQRSLLSLISTSEVCIKNRGYAEYLYAPLDDLKFDTIRRNVYTWVPLGEAGRQGDWKFQHIQGNEFYIINSKFKEHLYAENDGSNYDSRRRRIFTKQPTKEITGNVWAVEFDGNDVFLRNTLYDEYIYSLNPANEDKERRQVLAWIPKGREECDSESYQCRWSLSIC